MTKTYYFPDSEYAIDFFGSESPVCVDADELIRVSAEWGIDIDELMDQVHEANENEINEYGIYDTAIIRVCA